MHATLVKPQPGTSAKLKLPAPRPKLPLSGLRRSTILCRASSKKHAIAVLVGAGVGAHLLLGAGPVAAGLLDQPYSSAAAGDPASRVLVLDRERVERLLTNEFKQRLHQLPNDELVQLLDELLASQQTTAPQLFSDVLTRQQQQQYAAAQQAPQQNELGGAIRQGLSQLWGFTQSRLAQNPSLVQPTIQADVPAAATPDAEAGTTNNGVATTSTSTSTDSTGSSGGGSSSEPPAWKAPWGVGRKSTAPDQQQEALMQQQQQPAAADPDSSSQPQSPTWQLGLLSKLQQQQDQQLEPTANPAQAASAGSAPSATDTSASIKQAAASSEQHAASSSNSSREAAASASAAAKQPTRLPQLSQPEQQQQKQQQLSEPDLEAADDLGEDDITGGLLFGRPVGLDSTSGSEPETATTALAAEEVASSGGSLSATAAAKLQGLFHFPPRLPWQPDTAADLPAAGAPDAVAAAAAAAGTRGSRAAEEAAAQGGLFAVATEAAANRLQGLLDLPGEVASSVGGVLDDWRYEAADAVGSVLEEQGPTVVAVLGLTAAAGGGVLLLSSVLQPLLTGELASSSKLSGLLQQQSVGEDGSTKDEAETAPNAPQGATASSAAAAAATTSAAAMAGADNEAEAAAQSVAAGVAGSAGAASINNVSADAPTAAVAAGSSSGTSSKRRRPGLFDNVDVELGDGSSEAAAAAAVPWTSTLSSSSLQQPLNPIESDGGVAIATQPQWKQSSSSSSSTAPAAAGPNFLWQRQEEPSAAAAPVGVPFADRVSDLAPAAAAGAGEDGNGGAILWMREEVPPVADVGAAASPAAASGRILWERGAPEELPVAGIQQAAVAAAAAPALESSGSSSSSGSGAVLWQRDEAPTPQIDPLPAQQEQEQQQQRLGWFGGGGGRGISGRRADSRDSWLNRLLSNAEDVMESFSHPEQSWQEQQQPTPWQQGLHGLSEDGFQQAQQPASSSSISSSHAVDAATASTSSNTSRQDPRALWPAILATSSTAFAYSSLASVDLMGEADVSLVQPGDLPDDPWGTSPAGLVPSLQELRDLGVLQQEVQGLAAAAAASHADFAHVSPWSKGSDETGAAASYAGQQQQQQQGAGSAGAAGPETAVGGGMVPGGVDESSSTSSSSSSRSRNDYGSVGEGNGSDDAQQDKSSRVDDGALHIIGFFQ